MKHRLSKFANSSRGQRGSAASLAGRPMAFRPDTGKSACATSGTATPGCALLIALALILFTGLATSCRQARAAAKPDPLARAYDSEPDGNDPQQVISRNYQQAQGKQAFYQYCVWCHADSTPAGPSNRWNLNPNPPTRKRWRHDERSQ